MTFATLLAMTCACSSYEDLQPGSTAEVTFSAVCPETKAAVLEELEYEKAINTTQILAFDHSSGAIAAYGNGEGSTITISLATGRAYDVHAMVNCPDLSAVGSLEELNSYKFGLSANSLQKSSGFMMEGKLEITPGQNENSPKEVHVSRLASRITLAKITNDLPSALGSITLNSVFLSNVAAKFTLGGAAPAADDYINRYGRASGTEGSIIGTAQNKAACAEMTFSSLTATVNRGTPMQTPAYLYAYANPSQASPEGFKSTFAPTKTLLTVCATIAGKTCYYPVVLDGIGRNTAYTVELTIKGMGSDDPAAPVSKQEIGLTLTANKWEQGNTYTETI